MSDTIQEYSDSRGVAVHVDAAAGIIRGVKILGLESRNGRDYRPDALTGAAPLYEGAKVNVNHPKGSALAPRDYQDRIGTIRHVVFRAAEGLFADLHYNPAHALAGQLAWDAEHAPENVGFSHNVQARLSRQGPRPVVEQIVQVNSVDLVADPATTRGLYEQLSTRLDELTLDELRRQRPDLVEQIASATDGQRRQLHAELDRLRAETAARDRQMLVRRLLAEQHLPEPGSADPWSRTITSDVFFEALLAAADEAAIRRLIDERVCLVRAAQHGPAPTWRKPASRDQRLVDGMFDELDPASFARAIS